MLTTDLTPASCAAWANLAVASTNPGLIGCTKYAARTPSAAARTSAKTVEIADDDLCAAIAQLGGTVIQTMHQRPHAMATLEQQAGGIAACFAGGSSDEQS